MVLEKVNVDTQSCSEVFWYIWQVLSPHAVPVHVAFQFASHPNESPVSNTATLQSRPAMGCILMWQADGADLNLNLIFTHVVHTCALGWGLEIRTEVSFVLPELQLRA